MYYQKRFFIIFLMKKISLLIFFLIVVFALEGASGQITPPTPLGKHLGKAYKEDLPGLLKRRYIRVLTTFNKTNFYLAGPKTYGFEYSLLKEYEKYLNRKIKRRDLKVVIEFIPVRRDQLLPYLVKGYGDIAAAGLTITKERLKTVDFTDPYLYGINEIVVVHRSITDLRRLEDLSGKKVYVRKSSSYYESLQELNRKLRSKGLRPVKIVPVDESLETEDILEMVNSGAIKITISDSHIAQLWAKVLKDIRLLNHLAVRKNSKIAWAVRKDSPELKKSLNRFIKKVKKGTLLGNIYFKRYFKNTRWIKNPLGPSERAKIRRYMALFKTYGKKY
ncbi:MAG: lytic transglycosylase F, partial [Nitrospirae bacterium]